MPRAGLRHLSRAHLDSLCSLAACEIVNTRSCVAFDSYVLSESSMFVHPTKFMIKTCGTTTLLACVPALLTMAAELGLTPVGAKYSRASYKFPAVQPAPHQGFEQELLSLEHTFAATLGAGTAQVLGDHRSGLQWHIWAASRPAPAGAVQLRPAADARTTLEVCMTGLCPERALVYWKSRSPTALAMRENAGIHRLFPGWDIVDSDFEPCGYSMNALLGEAFANIHITPEDGFSYASVELCGLNPTEANAKMALIADIFRPQQMVVALSSQAADEHYHEQTEAAAAAEAALARLARKPGSLEGGLVRNGGATWAEAAHARVMFQRFLSPSAVRIPSAPEGPQVHAVMCKPSAPAPAPVPMAWEEEELQVASQQSTGAGPGTPPLERGCSMESEQSYQQEAKKPKLEAAPAAPKEVWEAEAAAALVAAQLGAQRLPATGTALDEHLRQLAKGAAAAHEDAFYTVDVGAALSRFEEWRRALPRVAPFYAVKCCGDPALVATLVALGAGFDCASPAEMELVLQHGAAPERIVYAHAVKPTSHIAAARAMGVGLMTFDSMYELDKAAATHPGASLVLRMHAADPHARCQLGNKFGAMPYEVEPLLLRAVSLGMRVVGLSFHIGSGAEDPEAFAVAIAQARTCFDAATRLGLPPLTLLDIGGGFSGGALGAAATAINKALDLHFPAEQGVNVIAEPGRFFAESTHTLCCAVYGKRVRPADEIGEDTDSHQYYLTDGLYGSFNCLLYDHATVEPRLLTPPMDAPQHKSTLFGPTCDGIDQVAAATMLPELAPGDWLRFDRMGAYTRCAGSGFNGFSNALMPTHYVFCRDR